MTKEKTNETSTEKYDVSIENMWCGNVRCEGSRDEQKLKERPKDCNLNDTSLLKFAIYAIICTCYIQLLPQYTNTVTHKNISDQTEKCESKKQREKFRCIITFTPLSVTVCLLFAVLCSMLTVRCCEYVRM